MAYEDLTSKEAITHVEPEDFGVKQITFVKDPNGLDIEIKLPNANDVFDMYLIKDCPEKKWSSESIKRDECYYLQSSHTVDRQPACSVRSIGGLAT